MMKSIALLPRKVGTTRKSFCDYYEGNHAPLAISLFPFKKYVRNHLPVEAETDITFDTISEFWIKDFNEIFALMGGDVGARMKADELNFMDQSTIRSGAAEEFLIRGAPRGIDNGITKTALLLQTGALTGRALRDAVAQWSADIAAERITCDMVSPWDGPGPAWPFNAVVWLWGKSSVAPPPAELTLWRQLTVSAHETSPDSRT